MVELTMHLFFVGLKSEYLDIPILQGRTTGGSKILLHRVVAA